LLSIIHSINPPPQGKRPVTSVEEKEAAPPEDDGWFEVGKRNRSLVTRTVSVWRPWVYTDTDAVVLDKIR
jgi:ubiquitin carboxyl-terminal hydrolase 10